MYSTGQTAVFIKNLIGKEFPAIAIVNRKRRVNGQREITLAFLYTEINQAFMPDIEFGWKVLFKGDWYTITHPGYATDGDYYVVDVTAVLSFFVDMNGYYLQNKVEGKSSTAAEFFIELLNDTPYGLVMAGSFSANTLSYEDNQSKTERFLYGIDQFNAEFMVRGNAVYLYELMGTDKNVILHDELNVGEVKVEVDASGFHTWAKGFGDLSEGDNPVYRLQVEYRSPLIAKYGLIEGPAIKDGNYKIANNLTDAVKKQVENSYKISTEIEVVDLINNGYPEMVFEEGDRVWLHVDRLNLNQQVRIMEIDETFDWEGNTIDAKYVLGNEGIASRYKTMQYDTLKDFQDILNGRKTLGYNWLPEAVKRAAEIINGNQDSLFKYLAGEIIGINQSNPNGYMRFNTDGIGFSRNGGIDYQTAMTFEGIVADAITTGTLYAALVRIMGRNGHMFMDGDQFKAIDPSDTEKYVRITPGKITAAKGSLEVIRPDDAAWIQNGIVRNSLVVQSTDPAFIGDNIVISGRYYQSRQSDYDFIGAYQMNHEGRYLVIEGYVVVNNAGVQVAVESYAGLGFYQTLLIPKDSSATGAKPFTITLDLGKPTYARSLFYIKMRSNNAPDEGRCRVNWVTQYG
ncbi:phage tail protein [Metabacillus indicus]|uniref:phage tail protein n=1 Tax=Metabacillus indicus TaxID=246786 RepID=UPI002A033097|nr:phage tail protein [Metabacillus indicus]MDX8288829.1 phage tail protein [Metabacillus indicus]